MSKRGQTLVHFLAAFRGSAFEFKREWGHCRQAGENEDGACGCWSGEWVSEENGHHGKLECIVKQATAERVSALFHATYWKILRVSYKVNLERQRGNDYSRLRGSANLGKLAGVFINMAVRYGENILIVNTRASMTAGNSTWRG